MSRGETPTLLTYFARFDLPDSAAGEWILSVPGGVDAGAFEATVTVPPVLSRTRPASIDRETGVDIVWDPDTVSENDRLAVILQTAPGSYLECRAPAKSGTLQLPARYLRSLPPSNQGVAGVIVSRPFEGHAVFSFPTAGEPGTGVLDYQLVSTSPVRVQ